MGQPHWGFITATIGTIVFIQNFFCPPNPATTSPLDPISVPNVSETPNRPEIRRENIVGVIFLAYDLEMYFFNSYTLEAPQCEIRNILVKKKAVDSSATAGPLTPLRSAKSIEPKRPPSLYGEKTSPTVAAVCKGLNSAYPERFASCSCIEVGTASS